MKWLGPKKRLTTHLLNDLLGGVKERMAQRRAIRPPAPCHQDQFSPVRGKGWCDHLLLRVGVEQICEGWSELQYPVRSRAIFSTASGGQGLPSMAL